MADKTGDQPKNPSAGEPPSAGAAPKRPFATIDLKATEIKVKPLSDRGAAAASSSSATATVGTNPGPAPASTYATATGTEPKGEPANSASPPKTGTPSAAAPATASGSAFGASPAADTPAPPAPSEKVVMKKRGGFFSHAAAGLIGGVLALAGAEWALPQLGIHGTTSRIADTTSALAARVALIEQKGLSTDAALNADQTARLAAIEKSVGQIPQLTESQARLVADTKAALAAAASDAGAPEQLTRLSAVEEKFKALVEAGANDPNGNRLAQLAALTGKVADLETSLSTQLTALRKSVAEDVEGRIIAATEASEAAKSGTQRIDRDVATVKGDAARLEERLLAMKAETDRTAAAAQLAQESAAALKSELNAAKSTFAKPADIAAVIGPVASRLTAIDQSIQSVMKAEDQRRSNAERIVLALELQNLKRALSTGGSYSVELASLQKAADASVDLSALDKFKDVGVPSADVLTKEFRTVAYAAIDAEIEPAEGGVMDRLLAGAKSVVRVRKVDHAADDKTAEAVVGRMEIALKDGRLGDVLSESRDLGPKALDAVRPFLDKVAARVSVDDAVEKLDSQLKTSLKPDAAAGPAP